MTEVYVLLSNGRIVGIFSTFDLANKAALTIISRGWEIKKYELDKEIQ